MEKRIKATFKSILLDMKFITNELEDMKKTERSERLMRKVENLKLIIDKALNTTGAKLEQANEKILKEKEDIWEELNKIAFYKNEERE